MNSSCHQVLAICCLQICIFLLSSSCRVVARYFFFSSILMERQFDILLWQNILLKSNLPKRCLKLKMRATLQGNFFYFWKKSFWYTWQFRSHFWISQGCFWLHLSATKCSQSLSFTFRCVSGLSLSCSFLSLLTQARKVELRHFKILKPSTWYGQCRKAM